MKRTILILTGYYLPGTKAGGPIRSIENLVDYLSNDYEIRIITKDRDLGDNTPYNSVNINEWNNLGKASIYYCPITLTKVLSLPNVINAIEYDCLYLNSYFDPIFTIYPLFLKFIKFIKRKIPVVIAPRGDLMDESMNIKSFKKNIFMLIANFLALYKDVIWQATNNLESRSILKYYPDTGHKLVIAQNLPKKPSQKVLSSNHVTKIKGKIRVCSIARISREKNLIFAIQVLNQSNSQFIFDIYGSIEDQKYWERCKSEINISKHSEINYKGILSHEQVFTTFKKYDLFFLPTTGENFGHSIVESMISGTPVLIADTTPWIKLKEKGIGWDFPLLEQQNFVNTIDEINEMGENEYRLFRERVGSFAINIHSDDVVQANKKLFKYALNKK